ncbi:MAG TPA: hypothetical protein VMF59_13665 [Bacteroidota bacterium]|nr:hypothetical protein [Bacteroidota bacterium]
MRTALLVLLLLPGCVKPAGETPSPAREQTARVLAALIDCAAANNIASLDAARRQAAADSVLRSLSLTREEFLAGVRALNADVTGWREVSEEAARLLEQRLAARSGAH